MKRDRKNHKGKEKKNEDDTDTDTITIATEDFFVLFDGDVVNLATQQSSWVIDSGASVHATSKREFFASYTPGDFGSVMMDNDGSTNTVGIGDVHLKNRNGSRLILKNVKHIPDIRMNLISICKLDDEGFCNTFNNGIWKLTKGSMVIAKGQKFSSLYYMMQKSWILI